MRPLCTTQSVRIGVCVCVCVRGHLCYIEFASQDYCELCSLECRYIYIYMWMYMPTYIFTHILSDVKFTAWDHCVQVASKIYIHIYMYIHIYISVYIYIYFVASGSRCRIIVCNLQARHVYIYMYSQLQIGWHRISRLSLNLFQRTRILPMGFTISTK